MLLRFVFACRPRAWSVCRLVRCRGFARLSRPLREQAVGGFGARGVRAQLRPSLGAAAHSGGGGTSLLPRGGWRAGAPEACRPEGGVGGRGEGGSRRGSRPPCPGGWPVAPGPVPTRRRRTPPGYICSAGGARQPRAPGAVGGSAWRGGGLPVRRTPLGPVRGAPRGGGRGGLFAAVCSPAFSGRAKSWVASSVHRPPCCIPRSRCSAAAHGVPLSAGAELPVGSRHCGSEWAADWGHWARGSSRRGCGAPSLGAAALSERVRGRRLPGRLPAVRGPGGERGGEGGGEGGFHAVPPWSPSPGGRGGAAWWFRSRGAPCSPLCRRVVRAGWGGGGLRAGESWAWRFRSAVSGSRAVGQWASPRARCPRPLPYLIWCAPLCRVVRWGWWRSRSGSGGLALLGGASRGTVSFPPPHCPGWQGHGRHLRRRLRGGWGCGGGRFRRR